APKRRTREHAVFAAQSIVNGAVVGARRRPAAHHTVAPACVIPAQRVHDHVEVVIGGRRPGQAREQRAVTDDGRDRILMARAQMGDEAVTELVLMAQLGQKDRARIVAHGAGRKHAWTLARSEGSIQACYAAPPGAKEYNGAASAGAGFRGLRA